MMTPERKNEAWITVAEAAERMMVSCETIRRYVKHRYLKSYRLPSGRIRIIESSLERGATLTDHRAK